MSIISGTSYILCGIKCMEVRHLNVNCFLGANSAGGFFSLYGGFCSCEGDFLHLIKAGPGGGKSGFMRRVARAATERGCDTECVLCSGDPDSLDAVYIPELHVGFVDATAPHACEPVNFAFNSDYVNLGRFCGPADDPRIVQMTDKDRAMYKTAYAYLAAAGSAAKTEIPGLISAETLEKVKKRAQSAALRELGGAGKKHCDAHEQRRFMRCISCKGELALAEDVQKLCKRIYLLDDRCGLADIYLKQMNAEAKERGFGSILCLSPLCPDRLDALLLPEPAVGFVSASAVNIAEPYRHVRLDALIQTETLQEARGALKRRDKLVRELTGEAVQWLARAKEYHDELERAYNPHVDFAALDAFTDEVIEKLFA